MLINYADKELIIKINFNMLRTIKKEQIQNYIYYFQIRSQLALIQSNLVQYQFKNIIKMQKKKVERSILKKIVPFHTLLIQQYIDICEKLKINLIAGSAEVNGVELKKNYPHHYSVPCSIPIYTWEGAEIKIQWIEYENTKNSSNEWIDITQKNNQNQSLSMIKYLQVHYSLVTLRKVAQQECKIGPRVVVVGTDQTASQNVSKLLLNYSGKYNMNPVYIDLDPQSSIFIDGSIGALQFEYKIIQDLYDRPNKICFYYGNRSIKSSTYLEQVKYLADCLFKKIRKQVKDYQMHGTKQQMPLFASGFIIQCPRYKSLYNKKDYFGKIREILNIFQSSHLISVGFPELQTYINENKVLVQSIKGPILQGTQSFLNLPRPLKSKIERYFNNESLQIKYPINQITIYQLMTQTPNQKAHCRTITIRQQTISKNTVAILHAIINQQEKQKIDKFSLYQKAIVSPIACLIRIQNIGENQITLEVAQEHFLEEFRNNIWVTSVNDQ